MSSELGGVAGTEAPGELFLFGGVTHTPWAAHTFGRFTNCTFESSHVLHVDRILGLVIKRDRVRLFNILEHL